MLIYQIICKYLNSSIKLHKKMYWNVVHFIQENSVEAVPSKWYNDKLKKCAWPKDKSKIKLLLKNNVK